MEDLEYKSKPKCVILSLCPLDNLVSSFETSMPLLSIYTQLSTTQTQLLMRENKLANFSYPQNIN